MKIQKMDRTLVGRIEPTDLVCGLEVVDNRPEVYVKHEGEVYIARMLKRVGRSEPYFTLRPHIHSIDPNLKDAEWVAYVNVSRRIKSWKEKAPVKEGF